MSACEAERDHPMTTQLQPGNAPAHSLKTVQHEHLDPPIPSSPVGPVVPVARSPLALHTAADVRAKVPPLLGWPPGETAIAVLSGGMSNSLYKLSHESRPPVVVRLFGQENVFSRDQRRRENCLVAELAAAHLAPALPAVFANGRVEQFLTARPIHARDMTAPNVYPLVAREMVHFHRFQPTPACGPIAQRPARGALPGPLALVEQYWSESAGLHAAGQLRGFDFARATEALAKWMRRFRANERCASGDGLVFGHNDLNPLNILRYDDGRVAFIDFEYAGWNYRACEIALHFAEAVAEEMHYELYPDEATLRDFCRVYLAEANGDDDGVDDGELDALVSDVKLFDAFAHLLWGFWGLARGCSADGPEFDFVEFAKGRLSACYHFHDWL